MAQPPRAFAANARPLLFRQLRVGYHYKGLRTKDSGLHHSRSVAAPVRPWRASSTLMRRSSLMVQFQRVKSQFPGYLLLFQVGDFYELYGDDASEVASKTSLRLTKKSGVFMAGFPVRALDEWQRVLVEAGLRLAICNQQPTRRDSANHTLMEREVVRLVTPGTLTEPLDQLANYLLCIAPGPTTSVGLAWTDVSTAEFKVSSVDVTGLDEDLERICPSEVLLPEGVVEAVLNGRMVGPPSLPLDGLLQVSRLRDCHLTPIPERWCWTERGEVAGEHRRLFDLMEDKDFSVLERYAGRGLLHYIGHTQRHTLPHLSPPSSFKHSQHLAIDASTRRSLELVSPLHNNPKKTTLLGSMDRAVTAAGARLLRARLASPLTDVDAINRRLDSVQLFWSIPFHRDALRLQLRACTDLERVLQKVATGSCTVTDLRAIKNTLSTAGAILGYIQDNIPNKVLLAVDIEGLCEFPDLVQELEDAIGGDNFGHIDYITTGFSREVDSLRVRMRRNEEAVGELAARLQSQTGAQRLTAVNSKAYRRVFEVSKAQAAKLEKCSKLVRVDHTQAKARFTHVELQRLNAELQELESLYTTLQEQLFQDLCDKVVSQAEDIRTTASALARLDVATSLGLLAEERGYSRPHLLSDPLFRVRGGLHPVLSSLPSSSTSFISNNCVMEPHRLWIVTGPNMGGKSTFLRQNALILIMAQVGSFVPAQEATIGVADRLFARIGATDNVSRHMSTFHMEMAETANILTTATHRSFVILDEIGRGTSTGEGLSIAEAVVEYLHDRIGCRTLVATHFSELALVSGGLDKAGSYRLVADKDQMGVIFTYRVEPGRASHSFGIEVAQSAGVPLEVIQRAKALLSANK